MQKTQMGLNQGDANRRFLGTVRYAGLPLLIMKTQPSNKLTCDLTDLSEILAHV